MVTTPPTEAASPTAPSDGGDLPLDTHPHWSPLPGSRIWLWTTCAARRPGDTDEGRLVTREVTTGIEAYLHAARPHKLLLLQRLKNDHLPGFGDIKASGCRLVVRLLALRAAIRRSKS